MFLLKLTNTHKHTFYNSIFYHSRGPKVVVVPVFTAVEVVLTADFADVVGVTSFAVDVAVMPVVGFTTPGVDPLRVVARVVWSVD